MLKIGHRGAMGYEPENTLRSFAKALELGVDMIELDVYVCQSGELVVIHDDKVDRTTNGHGYVVDKTFTEIRSLLIAQGEKIPTLSEVFDLVDKKVPINVELKGEHTAEPVAQLIGQYIKEKDWTAEHFLVSSFDHYELKRFKELMPEIRVGALIAGIPIGYSKFAEEVSAYSVHLSLDFARQKYIADAHQRGFKVFVYTVNDKDDINKMKELGVDGLFSNYPDRI
ncbi:glycerophosphodiester phosphodiesterase [Candidatus Parcubacteria bacterium]|nr:MAG: glycerophosphodiester phosphodiesterase [Candidatus Parcubacteria bacterium]